MILDSLKNSFRYEGLGPRFAHAFAWLRSVDLSKVPDGRTNLDGEDLYVMAYRNAVKPLDETIWEAHRKYADIQFVVEGREAMFWESLENAVPGKYMEEQDFLTLEVEGWADLEIPAGQFVVFFPGDAHRPGIDIPGVDSVYKLVVKVKL